MIMIMIIIIIELKICEFACFTTISSQTKGQTGKRRPDSDTLGPGCGYRVNNQSHKRKSRKSCFCRPLPFLMLTWQCIITLET